MTIPLVLTPNLTPSLVAQAAVSRQPYTYLFSTDGVGILVWDRQLQLVSYGSDLGVLVNAVAQSGFTLALAAGSFPAATRINFSGLTNVSLVGESMAATTIAGSGSQEVLKWNTNATGGHCRDLTVTTSATNPTGIAIVAADCVLERVKVTCNAATATGVSVQSGADRVQIIASTVSGAKTQGILLSVDDPLVERCQVTGCGDGTATAQAGINVSAGQRAELRFNRCESNGTHGIRYASTGADGPQILGNKCRTNGALAAANLIFGAGITITSASGCAGGVVAANRCTGNYENGIGVAVNGTVPVDIAVTGNYCGGNNVGGFVGGHGIEIDAPGSTASGNVCTGNNNGISVTASSVTVSGNTCYSNSGSQGNGIAVNGAGCTVTGNTCHDNGNDGVKLFTNTTGTCTGNTVYSNTGYGLEVTATGRIVVGTHNAFSNTGGQGVFAAGSLLCGWLGSGTPASTVTAAVGSTFQRTDGGTTTTLYVKESGTGNTGWVAK